MAEQSDELKKLINVATDMVMDTKLRKQSIELIGNIGTHQALLALLELAANEKLSKGERDLTLKLARNIVKSG